MKVFLRFELSEGKKLSSTIIFLEFSRNFSAFDASSNFRVFFPPLAARTLEETWEELLTS